MLHMQGVTKVYRTELVETHALRALDLHVREGEFVAVTGPSGSGKTTFLNIAGLLEEFTGGTYLLDGEDVSKLGDDARSKLRNRKIGFIFQSFNLIPDLNLFDNVDAPLRYRGMPASERRQRIEDALTKVGLGSRMRHYPSELSGGQQQRAAIARTLVQGARVVLADEPIASLDPEASRKVMEMLARINREDGSTIVVSLHQVDMAKRFCQRVIALHQGRVVYDGPAADLSTAMLRDLYGMQADEILNGSEFVHGGTVVPMNPPAPVPAWPQPVAHAA